MDMNADTLDHDDIYDRKMSEKDDEATVSDTKAHNNDGNLW